MPANPEDPSIPNPPCCARCGEPMSGALGTCPNCARLIADANAEIGHIAYLLLQIQGWRAEGLLSRLFEERLHARYSARQALLRRRAEGTAPPIAAEHQPAPASDARAESGKAETQAGAASLPAEPPSRASIPRLPAADQGGIVRLLQDHALKLVFALATLFVLSALRGILAWPWFDALVLRLLPAIPLSLAGMFGWFGTRTRRANLSANPWAAFIYEGVATVLLASCVYPINSGWLHGVLSSRAVLLAGCALFTATTGGLLAQHRQIAYLHLFQCGALALLYALLQSLRVGAGDMMPLPVARFGVAYLLYAAVCLGAARLLPANSSGASGTGSWREAWTFWTHASAAAAGGLVAVGMLAQTMPVGQLALLTLLAGAIYTAAAHLAGSARLVFLSCGFLAAGALLWLIETSHRLDPAGLTLLLLAIAAFSLAIAAYDVRIGLPTLACAYRLAARTGVTLATAVACEAALPGVARFLPWSSTLGLAPGAGLLLLCAVFWLEATARAQHRLCACIALGSSAVASALLTAACLQTSLRTPQICLLPCLLFTSALTVAWRRPVSAASTASYSLLPAPGSLWRGPIVGMALTLLWLVLSEDLIRLVGAAATPLTSLWMALALAAAALLATEADVSRSIALPALGLGMGLEAAALCHLPGGLSIDRWPWDRVLALACALTLLAWGWWLLALWARRRRTDWSDTAGWNGLATAGVAALLLAGIGGIEGSLLVRDLCFTALFALFVTDSLAMQRDVTARAALGIWGLATWSQSSLILSHAGAATTWTLGSLACGFAYLVLGRRAAAPGLTALSGIPALAGVGFCAILWIRSASGADLTLCRTIWTVGGVVLAGGWLHAACWSEPDSVRCSLAYAAGPLLALCWLQGCFLAAHPAPLWAGLLILPLVPILEVGLRLARRDGSAPETAVWNADLEAFIGQPLRQTLTATVILMLAWSIRHGDGFAAETARPWIITSTLACAAALYGAMAVWKRDALNATLGVCMLTAAYLHLLLQRTALFVAPPAALSWPCFAFLAAQAGLFWVVTALCLRRRIAFAPLATPLAGIAAVVALLSAGVGLWTVHTPHEGVWAVAALAWCGAIWIGLWLLENGDICLHVGAWNLITLCALVLYDRLGYQATLLDAYLLPIGLYLAGVGHAVSRAGRSARWLWWAALLIMLTPAFLAAWQGAESGHTVLLVVECAASVLWGIVQRVRAFVSAGLIYAALYAAAVGLGHASNLWGALAALLIGVGLFATGFFVLTHRETARNWAKALEQRRQSWLAWR